MSRFNQICFRFRKDVKPFGQELYDWCLYLLYLSYEQYPLRNDEPVISSLNELPLKIHVSQDTSPSINFYPRRDFIMFDNVTKTIGQQPILRFCVSHLVLDKKQEDVTKGA